MSSKTTEASFRQGMELNKIFCLACNQADPTDEQMEDLLNNPDPVYKLVAKLFHKEFDPPEIRRIKSTWAKVYKDYLNLKVDFSKLQISDGYDPTKHWMILVPKGISMFIVGKEMKRYFNVSRKIVDFMVTRYSRIADRDYCILVYKNVEADEDLRNLTDKQLSQIVGFHGITLLERLLLEMLYFYVSHGRHLDTKSCTLCSGSHNSEGEVPIVGWVTGEKMLYIDFVGPNDISSRCRARKVLVSGLSSFM